MNVGASAPEDAGLYFSWGNIEGVSADDEAAVEGMTEAAYANTPGASVNHDLSLATEDAAAAIMGVDWCMPDDEDLQELIDECDWEWVTINGVIGYRISSKQPGNTNSIFLPAAGFVNDGALMEENVRCLCWSSKYTDSVMAVWLNASENNKDASGSNERFSGCTIRARLA